MCVNIHTETKAKNNFLSIIQILNDKFYPMQLHHIIGLSHNSLKQYIDV
jgi:hypothetical protein